MRVYGTRVWAVVALALLAGCAKRVDTAAAAAGGERKPVSYYPLAVGNSWTYRVKFLGEQREQKVEILREAGGYFEDSQGGKLTADTYGIRDQKRYLLRYPIEPGTTWSNVVSVSAVEHYKIIEAGTRCEVPAGSFDDCVRVESRTRVDQRTTLVNRSTFAPNVGLVRIDIAAETGGKWIPQTELVLASYRVVGDKAADAAR